ncbi:MAG: hypothetical protein HY705_03675 [Gemmatimonadetes bacterium]|nr:hypothetical protein [Gemmatimonadota bacterium]
MKRNTKRGRGWLAVVAAAAVVVTGLVALGRAGGHGHPMPRTGITGERVLPRSMLAGYSNEVAAYSAARAHPAVLDGLYCHCDCSQHSGHRSLLTCFESQHGASCEVCQREAIMGAEMHGRGATLDQIRQAVDAQFGG